MLFNGRSTLWSLVTMVVSIIVSTSRPWSWSLMMTTVLLIATIMISLFIPVTIFFLISSTGAAMISGALIMMVYRSTSVVVSIVVASLVLMTVMIIVLIFWLRIPSRIIWVMFFVKWVNSFHPLLMEGLIFLNNDLSCLLKLFPSECIPKFRNWLRKVNMDPAFIYKHPIHLIVGLLTGSLGLKLDEGILKWVACFPISDDLTALDGAEPGEYQLQIVLLGDRIQLTDKKHILGGFYVSIW